MKGWYSKVCIAQTKRFWPFCKNVCYSESLPLAIDALSFHLARNLHLLFQTIITCGCGGARETNHQWGVQHRCGGRCEDRNKEFDVCNLQNWSQIAKEIMACREQVVSYTVHSCPHSAYALQRLRRLFGVWDWQGISNIMLAGNLATAAMCNGMETLLSTKEIGKSRYDYEEANDLT